MIPDWAGYLRFRPEFAQVTDPAFYPIEWLDGQILTGAAWPIIGENAAIIVECKHYPGGASAAHCLVAAGDLQEIVECLAPMGEAWGREHGCDIALVESREGWSRALKPHGYEVHQIRLQKVL